jgi:Zn-dependent M28 family amino/carboxypeptidase
VRLTAVLSLALPVALAGGACRPAPAPPPAPGVATDVTYLASRALAGREAGTPGGDSAAAYIVRRYESLGLRGAFRAACGAAADCRAAYLQVFRVAGRKAHNVAAVVPGSDPRLRDEYVVVGAHFDHLGRSSRDALDPEVGDGVIRPGADDNASGTAAVLELARRLAARPPRRSVLLANFDAEELGLVGSEFFVSHAPAPLTSMVLMVNLDMVGRLRTGGLTVDGARRSQAVRALLDSAAAAVGVRVRHSSAIAERSDHASFAGAGVPAVALFTGFHSDYHRVTDVAARVDVPGVLRVTDVAEWAVRAAADREARPRARP